MRVVHGVSAFLASVAISPRRGRYKTPPTPRPQHGLGHEGVRLLFLESDDGGMLVAFLGLVVGVVSVPELDQVFFLGVLWMIPTMSQQPP